MAEGAEWVWDRGQYDDVGRRLVDVADTLVETAAAGCHGLQGLQVVDLACGTGNAALAAARRGAEVTGVDLGAGLLTIAGESAGATDLDVTWLLGDVTATGLPDASFDVALSSVGLIFVPDRVAALSEVARLVRPGGWFGYTAWLEDRGSPFFRPFGDMLSEAEGDGPWPWQWAEPETVRPELARDFTDVEIQSRVHQWSFADVGEAVRMVHASPMHVAAMDEVAPADQGRMDEAFERAFGDYRGADGTVRYDSAYVVVSARRRT